MAAAIKPKATRVIVIEGLIGAGKTTLVHQLALQYRLECWRGEFEFAREPLGYYKLHRIARNNPLKDFYAGRITPLEFQLHVSHELYMRDRAYKKTVQAGTHRAVVMERHLGSCYAFIRLQKERGAMDTFQEALATQQIDLLESIGNIPTCQQATLIYLDIAPQLAFERIRQRSRSGEGKIDVDYLTHLKRAQKAEFKRYKQVIPIPITETTKPEEVCMMMRDLLIGQHRPVVESPDYFMNDALLFGSSDEDEADMA